MATTQRIRIANEFAVVDVRLAPVNHGVLLELLDRQAGTRVRLDALELEALTRLTADQRLALVDPSGTHPDEDAVELPAEGVIW